MTTSYAEEKQEVVRKILDNPVYTEESEVYRYVSNSLQNHQSLEVLKNLLLIIELRKPA